MTQTSGHYRALGIPLIFIAFNACSLTSADTKVTLGQRTFCVPDTLEVIESSNSESNPVANSDKSLGQSFMVTIDARTVAKDIPEYQLQDNGYEAVLFAKFTYVGENRLKALAGPENYLDMLRLTGEYERASVSYDEKNGAYRVSTETEPNPLFWSLLTRKPGKGSPLPEKLEDFYLGSCSVFGGNSTSCSTTQSIEGYHVKLDTTEQNLFLTAKINKYLSGKLQEWESNCR